MGATVADLVLGTSVDPSGITAGLAAIQQQIERTLAQSNAAEAGSTLATSLIAGLTKTFNAGQAGLAEQVAKGIISPAAFATASAAATDEFKHGLSKGLGNLAVEGKVTDAIRQQFEAAYGSAGSAAGAAFNASLRTAVGQTSTLIQGLAIPTTKVASTAALQSEERAYQAAILAGNLDLEQRIRVTQDLTRVQDALAAATVEAAAATAGTANGLATASLAGDRLGRSIETTNRGFLGLGERGNRELVGIAFALGNLSQGLGDSSSKVEGLLRSISLLALGFGTGGLLVAGIASATDAIVGIFNKTHDELEKLRKDTEQSIEQLFNAGNVLGLLAKQRDIFQGNAALGPSTAGGFVGGLADLKAKADAAAAAFDKAHTAGGLIGSAVQSGAGATIVSLFQVAKNARDATKAFTDAQGELKNIQDLLARGVPNQEITLKPFEIQGTTGIERLQAAVDHLAGAAPLATAALAALPTAFTGAAGAQDKVTVAAQRFVDTYNHDALAAFDAVNRAIAAQGTTFNETTAKLAAMRQQLAGLDIVQRVIAVRVGLAPATLPEPLTAKLIVPDTAAFLAAIDRQIAQTGVALDVPVTVGFDASQVANTIKANADRIQAQLSQNVVTVPLSFDTAKLQDLGQQAADIQQAIQATQAAGLGSATSDELARQHDILGQLTDAWRSYIARLIAGGASAHELAAALEQAKKAGVDVSSLASSGTNHLADDLHKAGEAASRIGQAFHDDVVTGIGAALDAVGNLKSAIDTLKAPDLNFGKGLAAVGEIGSAVGAVVGLISSAFGPSKADIERNQIIQRNNDALATLTNSLNNFGSTGGSLDAITKAAAHLDAAQITNAALANSAGGVFPTHADIDELMRELEGTGVTFAQLKAEADKLGITLEDSAGHIIPSALKAFQDALGATAFSLTHLSQAFDDQQKASELLRRATGKTDPLAALQDSISNFTKATEQKPPANAIGAGFVPFPGASGSQLFDEFFKGIDVTTKAGQQELRVAIGHIIEAVQAGTISLQELGKFGSVQDLETALGGLLDNLDAFGNAVDAATNTLLNVPQGFKVALARFDATIPTPVSPVVPPPPSTLPPARVPTEPTVIVPPPVIVTPPRTLGLTADLSTAASDRIGESVANAMRPLLDAIAALLRLPVPPAPLAPPSIAPEQTRSLSLAPDVIAAGSDRIAASIANALRPVLDGLAAVLRIPMPAPASAPQAAIPPRGAPEPPVVQLAPHPITPPPTPLPETITLVSAQLANALGGAMRPLLDQVAAILARPVTAAIPSPSAPPILAPRFTPPAPAPIIPPVPRIVPLALPAIAVDTTKLSASLASAIAPVLDQLAALLPLAKPAAPIVAQPPVFAPPLTVAAPQPGITPPRAIEFAPQAVALDSARLGDAIATALRPIIEQSSGRSFMKDLANEIASVRGGGDTYNFDVSIDGSTLSADEILQAVRKAAQQKARALFGTTARAAETLNV